jgi:hypothetical protein
MVLAGEHDATPLNGAKSAGCWACEADSPHSRAYHDRELAKVLSRYTTKRVKDDGTVWLSVVDGGSGGGEEGEQG